MDSDKSLQWLYKEPISSQDFLLGKKIVMSATETLSSGLLPSKVEPSFNDSEVKTREDPLSHISKEEKDRILAILKNPLQMKRLKREVNAMKDKKMNTPKDEVEYLMEQIKQTKEKRMKIKEEKNQKRRRKNSSDNSNHIHHSNRRDKYKYNPSLLEEMKQNVNVSNDIQKIRQLNSNSTEENEEREKFSHFLSSIQKEAYIEHNDDIGMRINRRSYYRQKGDLENQNFLKK